MKIKEIIQPLERLAPLSLQENYDNAGLIIGNGETQCTGILTSLDVTESVVEEAVKRNCNLIVAHHPIIFRGIKKLNGKNYVERTVISAIKNNDWTFIANEINTIMPIIRNKGKVIKVIIESGVLSEDEIIKCCDIYGAAGVDFVKTSTGYAEKGASINAVKLIRAHLSDAVKIKASGGIKSFSFAKVIIITEQQSSPWVV